MQNEKEIKTENWERIARYLSKETGPDENSDFEAWLSQNDENLSEYDKARQLYHKTGLMYQSKRFDAGLAYQHIVHLIDQDKSGSSLKIKRFGQLYTRFYKYAAVVLFAVLLGITGYYLTGNKPSEVVFSEVKSTDLPVNEYILPDGSKVSLNKGSKIVFPETFDNEIREITLEGEGFFEITHNPNQPFVIHAGKSKIKVLGTSFNVNAYSDNSTVEVVVKTGKVMLNGSGIEIAENNSVYLTAGEKGTFFKKKNTIEKSTNTNPNFLSWKTHDLEFDKMPLSEVAACIENLYSVDIQLDESLSDLKLTAYFENKPVDFVLNVIKITFNLELTNHETVYNFKPKK